MSKNAPKNSSARDKRVALDSLASLAKALPDLAAAIKTSLVPPKPRHRAGGARGSRGGRGRGDYPNLGFHAGVPADAGQPDGAHPGAAAGLGGFAPGLYGRGGGRGGAAWRGGRFPANAPARRQRAAGRQAPT